MFVVPSVVPVVVNSLWLEHPQERRPFSEAADHEDADEHQGEAMIRWGYGAPEMRCVPK